MEILVFAVGVVFGACFILVINALPKKSNDAPDNEMLRLMKTELEKVRDTVSAFEKERSQKYGELSAQLKQTAEQTQRLQETTGKLHTALANTNARGQWGERMAEDILRLFGFIEGVNYLKQKSIEDNSRPDYTFLLPQNLKLNMDVKFPFDNYKKYCDCDNDFERQQYKNQFMKDVKNKIKEVKARDYINSETVDYVIIFIPNEQVYGFINESDNSVLDFALQHKVVICSPLTLYAILAIMRQAIDTFKLEETASQVLSAVSDFSKQWEKYVDSVERLGERINKVQEEFNQLNTTRRRQLQRQIDKVESLKGKKVPAELLAEGNFISDDPEP